jgi:multisubunit Na+/H+ antiporter MnhB subunit
MTLAWVFDAILAATVLGVAGWTIATRQTFAAVVGFVAYGLLLALVWVRLRAPDVALTEAAIGGGVTGVLLLGAAARLRGTALASAEQPPGAGMRLATGVFCGAITAVLGATMLLLPDPAPTLAPEAATDLAAIGVGNPITGVLMAYRALDTLLEKVVLVLALIGVWSLTPDSLWGGIPGLQRQARPDEPLVFLARLLPPVGIVVAFYLLWVGADEPGGAFQGGALLAAMWLLAMMAGLTAPPPVSERRLRLVLVAGPGVFLAIGVLGFAVAGGFLSYPEAYAKPLIIVIEVAKMLSVAATLGLLVAGPPQWSPPR